MLPMPFLPSFISINSFIGPFAPDQPTSHVSFHSTSADNLMVNAKISFTYCCQSLICFLTHSSDKYPTPGSTNVNGHVFPFTQRHTTQIQQTAAIDASVLNGDDGRVGGGWAGGTDAFNNEGRGGGGGGGGGDGSQGGKMLD